RDLAEDLDLGYFRRRFERAKALRERTVPGEVGFRVAHAEADELPGIVVDSFDGHLVVQLRYAGAEQFRSLIVSALGEIFRPKGIYERSDMEGRKEEGLPPVAQLLAGTVPEEVVFREGPARFRAAVQRGHKTGFYLDQRDNRRMIAARVREGTRVLDAFSSTGAFSVHAALAGATVVAVEKDPHAAEIARLHAADNGVGARVEVRTADAFDALPKIAAAGERFDIAIVDPPAIAKKKEEQGTARWGFVTLATAALKCLSPGGVLFVSSCAYHLTPTLLEETIRIAGAQTSTRLRVVTETFQPPDHPWILQIPETLYLKSVLVEAA
ncbi:MAG TPA: class I SAM-dependent rRNA methyltransferase, partial [bacterium]|nr:class I SAM-dependent rRNA methyltransferase [bacterium]